MMERSVSSKRVAVGGGVAFDTVTADAADVVVFPAPSRATAVRVCGPSGTVVVFQLMVYGTAVSSGPSGDPSTKNCTPTTATLSEASARTAAVPFTDAPLVGEAIATGGGAVAGGDPVTSNASTVTKKSLDAAFFVRVTSIANVCGPAASGGDEY